VLKVTWSEPPGQDGGRALFGGRVQLSGLELPALLFAFVIALQLVPLPPPLLQIISPRTAEIYSQSLPGYGEEAEPTFTGLPAWLQRDPEPTAGGVPALPPDPEAASEALPEEVFELFHPAWRPISLTPADTRRALGVYLAHFALFVVAFNQFRKRGRSERFMLVLAILVGFLAVEGILQDLTAEGKLYWWRSAGTNYSFGPFVNHNNFAGWMEMALPLTAGLAAMIRQRQQRDRNLSARLVEQFDRPYAYFILLCFISIIGAAAFVISKSRGGLIALTTAVVVICVAQLTIGRLKLRTAVIALVLLLTVLSLTAWIGGAGTWSRYGTLSDVEGEPSFQFRVAISKETLKMAADFPLLGTGFGSFEEAFGLYTPGTSFKTVRRAHNDYAQVISECGLLGALAIGWGLIVLLKGGLFPALVRRGSRMEWPVRGAAVGVLALLLHTLGDFNLQIYSNSLLFAFLCAFLMRDRRAAMRSGSPAAG
jgi:O-antigen ligase